MFITLAVNGQFFAGTGLGIGVTDGNFRFNFNPEIGYNLNEKMDVGLGLDLSLVAGDNTNWLIAPFARYSVYEYEGIELLARGNVFIGGMNSSTIFGFSMVPMVIYNLNEKIELQAIVDFLTLRFSVHDSTVNCGIDLETRAASPIRFGFAYKF